MVFVYLTIVIVIVCCLVNKYNFYKQKHKKERKTVSRMFSGLPKEVKYEMFKTTYDILKNDLFFLEKNAKTKGQFAEITKIKYIMKKIKHECEKLGKGICCH